MKTKFRIFTVFLCTVICLISFTACNGLAGKSTLLGQSKEVESVDYSKLGTDEYKAFKKSVETFAADFAAYSYRDYKKKNNFAVSPISVYMALALSSECAAGDTRREILDALGVTHQQLKTNFSSLYSSLAVEHKADGKTTGLLNPTNSIWVNEGTEVKQPCIDALSNDFYAYSYSADFKQDNERANKAVRDFVKKQTKGLIDKDFELSDETLFTLINTLYLKTIWNTDGKDLPFAKDKYDFTAKDGSVKKVKLLQGDYISGRTAEFDTFTTFYTKTYDGYKIKFILPKENYTVDQVFSAENLAAVNSIAYYDDYSANEHYLTRVLFPEYKCKYDENIVGVLRNNFDIDLFFKDSGKYSPACDFSTLSDNPCHCEKIQHVTDLTVNRKGIEGAAVTVEAMCGNSAPAPMVIVKKDFVVNKSFGFIITDWQDITLFSGVVDNI